VEISDESDEESSTQPSKVKTRASLGTAAKPISREDIKRCFFCEETGRVGRYKLLISL
jgi:hypothetical protein